MKGRRNRIDMLKKENILVMVIIGIVASAFVYWQKSGSVEDAPLVSDGGIAWNEYSAGLEKARVENKQIFLYFYADW